MFDFILFVLTVAAAFFWGTYIEKRHYRKIKIQESLLRRLPVNAIRDLPADHHYSEAQLMSASVVISVDYFKRFAANLKSIFGGRLHTYESLLDRCRREATIRLKKEALTWGAKEIYNFKMDSTSIAGRVGSQGGMGAVEVIAYGTAVK